MGVMVPRLQTKDEANSKLHKFVGFFINFLMSSNWNRQGELYHIVSDYRQTYMKPKKVQQITLAAIISKINL